MFATAASLKSPVEDDDGGAVIFDEIYFTKAVMVFIVFFSDTQLLTVVFV